MIHSTMIYWMIIIQPFVSVHSLDDLYYDSHGIFAPNPPEASWIFRDFSLLRFVWVIAWDEFRCDHESGVPGGTYSPSKSAADGGLDKPI